MITAHSLRKAPPSVAEQLATKDEAPSHKKKILLMLGIAAVIAYGRSFFTQGEAFAGQPPAEPDAEAGPGAPQAGFGRNGASRDDGSDSAATDDAWDRAPQQDVLPVADAAVFFELRPYLASFEVGRVSSNQMAFDDRFAALGPLAYRGSIQSHSRLAFESVPVAEGTAPGSTGTGSVPVPLDVAGQDISGAAAGGTGGSTGGTDAGAAPGGTDAGAIPGSGTGGTDVGAIPGGGTGGTDTGVAPGGGTGGTDTGVAPGGGTGGTGGTDTGGIPGGGTGGTGGTDTGVAPGGGTGGTGGTDTGGTGTGGIPGGGTGVPPVPAPGAQPARIGTGLADVQTGTPGADQVFGLGGDDNIDAGDGADYVDGGLGDDLIAGRDGADTLLGAEGDDILDGGTGNDILYGQEGDDRLFGTQGDDILFGGAGSDALFGGDGGDILSGGDGDDLLMGDDGDDILDGQAGTDRLFDGLGRDVVSGGEGDDRVSVAADADEDSFFGNAGFDVLDLSAAEAGLTIDLAGQTVTGPAALDRFDGFEQITGGAGEDLFLAGGQGMTLAGGAGADVFDFSLVPGMIPGQQMAFFRITDFQAGDMLKLPGNLTLASLSGTGGLFGLTQAEPTLASLMGPAQDYTQDTGAARLRFATEASDSLVHTVITADVDNDGAWDFEVSIDGWVPSDAVPQDFHLTQPLQQ